MVEDRAGKQLFVANRISNDVAVLDAQTGAEEKRLAGRARRKLHDALARWQPDLRHARLSESRTRTTGGTAAARVRDHGDRRRARRGRRSHSAARASPACFMLRSLPMAGWARRPSMHPKNLVPLAHLEHGGAFADTLTLFGADVGKPVEIPLDELERYAAQPFGVAIAPDKSRHLRHAAAARRCVLVIDVPRLLHFIHAHAPESGSCARISRPARITWWRAFPWATIRAAWRFSRDGRKLFVANRLDDTISVIDTRTNRVVSTIALAGPKTDLASCATASRPSTPRATRSRARSAAPTATSIPPSTGSVGPGAGRLRPRHRGQPAASKT